ncbi:Signal recognition particle 43 kDa protein [Forsythia ovata]|uniref:Signal recognition particle 43 kDa protein n=1 Tax=Forsythia ovata TaxID=205694 RepID=A0ABD1UYE3_9LAMI
MNNIIRSRALQNGSSMESLIEWKDEHVPTWVPSDYIVKNVIAEYETLWWNAVKKSEETALQEVIKSGDRRDIDAMDEFGLNLAEIAFSGASGGGRVNLMILKEQGVVFQRFD